MSAITAYKATGVPRTTIQFCTQFLFKLPRIYRDCFKSYYLLYWSNSFFFSALKDGHVTSIDGKSYGVLYLGTTPARLRRCAQVALSFREPIPEFNIPATVLVKEGNTLK